LHNLIFDTQSAGLRRNRLRKRRYHGWSRMAPAWFVRRCPHRGV